MKRQASKPQASNVDNGDPELELVVREDECILPTSAHGSSGPVAPSSPRGVRVKAQRWAAFVCVAMASFYWGRRSGYPSVGDNSDRTTDPSGGGGVVRGKKAKSPPGGPASNNVPTDKSDEHVHPRVACFGCRIDELEKKSLVDKSIPPSIPTGKTWVEFDTSSDDGEDCILPDPSHQSRKSAPPTCNDVHSLGLDSNFMGKKFAHDFGGSPVSDYHAALRPKMRHVADGAFKTVWKVTSLDGAGNNELLVLKTNKNTRDFAPKGLENNYRDALVSEGAGKVLLPLPSFYGSKLPPLSSSSSSTNYTTDPSSQWNYALPIYRYCAFSSIAAYGTLGPLDAYVTGRSRKKDYIDATDLLYLALQTARGLYQAHSYKGGKATFAHADVKPDQFLLFAPPTTKPKQTSVGEGGDDDASRRRQNANDEYAPSEDLPAVQINDFNRGRFLRRHRVTNETCPFRMCNVHHKGSTYRSPEEYMDCEDQTDKVDVYSLGGVFFFLLSDGHKPYYNLYGQKEAVSKILHGKLPKLPGADDYKHMDDDDFREMRTDHPAYAALVRVMIACQATEPGDRPSSLEVVWMLEDEMRRLGSSN